MEGRKEGWKEEGRKERGEERRNSLWNEYYFT
jgi:hypothetical protein